MFFVERALARPNRCAIVPFIGQSHDKGYVDLGILTAVDPNVYLSIEGLQEVARRVPQANLVSKDELTKALAENEVLKLQLEELRGQMVAYDKELNAIHTLTGRGYSKQRKPGRKPTKV